ncbi:MAG: TetR/AcrR family transcriptional regulator [Pseudonocardia sp.]|nr:TetR/AcrR family transcriptional regulator [Pseudonocardia sp.]
MPARETARSTTDEPGAASPGTDAGRAPSTRDRLLDGAFEVMRARGLAHTTTKQIARAAGYSEATLYKTFADKIDLFLCVLTERLPRVDLVSGDLADRVGHGTVADTLRQTGEQLLAFYAASFPISASVFADASLLVRYREGVLARGRGPATVNQVVADYLRAEQRVGRIAPDARPDALAAALVGGCFQRAFLRAFTGEAVTDAQLPAFVNDLVETLLPAMRP